MTDQPTSVSPWRRLAEDWLGFSMSGDCCRAGDITEEDTQDLLIGRALRVAWEHNLSTPKVLVTDWIWMACVQKVTNSQGDSRALAAIELLEAVGYGK